MFHRLAILFVLALALFAVAAQEEYTVGALRIAQPWSLALPPVSANGAVYFSVTNTGKSPDRLIGGSTPTAGRVELHQHTMDGGVMRMRRVPAVEVPAGGSAELKPGTLHLMLLGLKKPLVAGQSFPLTLEFERAGRVQVQVRIRAAEAQTDPRHAKASDHSGDTQKAGASVRRFDFSISGGTVAADKRRIRVTQGERVELHWTSDAPLVLHLHGYDIEARVVPGSPATMRFLAKATGRFPVETHSGGTHGAGHGVLLYFEVYPK